MQYFVQPYIHPAVLTHAQKRAQTLPKRGQEELHASELRSVLREPPPFPGKQPVTLPGFTRDGAVAPGGAALRHEARLRRRQEEQELLQPEPWSFPCPWQRLV